MTKHATFFRRLRERKLIQWALAYLAGAWLALEVFSTLQEGLGWPPELFPTVVAALSIGLIVTLVLAWYHGEQGRQRVSAAELLIIAGLLLVAGLLLSRFEAFGGSADEAQERAAADSTPGPHDAGRPTIAVLPFENRSGLEEDEYFVKGVHDEVLTQLYKIRSLDTKSQTSVLAYRESPKNLRTIGQELGVRFIVEGGVQRAGGTIRMSVRLFDARTDERLWGDSYDRELTVANMLDLQREIALEVATRLGAEALPGERAQLAVEAPENLMAYERYLDGLSHLRTLTLGVGDQREARERAIESLNEAITAAPRWAPPYAALGRVYHFVASGGVGPSENFARSRAALDAALALDSLHGPAWASLGFVLHNREGDFRGAEAAYQRAFALGWPQRWGYAILLTSWGRFDEAVEAFEEAASFDPLSVLIQYQLGLAQVCAGGYERAIEQLQEAFGIQDRAAFRPFLAYAYLKTGRRERGLAELDRMGEVVAGRALVYALADSIDRAGTLLAEAERAPPTSTASGLVAATSVVLGDRDRALDYMESAMDQNPRSLSAVQCLDEVRSLEGDPRYERVLDRLGVPDGGTRDDEA